MLLYLQNMAHFKVNSGNRALIFTYRYDVAFFGQPSGRVKLGIYQFLIIVKVEV